jgi:TM2 domain-containing membrane protein YozV
VQRGLGAGYCNNCGKEAAKGAAVCLSCGAALSSSANGELKSKLVAGLLGIFLGAFGVHNFYLGYAKKAKTQLILGLVGILTCGILTSIIGIWGIIDAIYILTGKINVDGDGKPLND